MKRTSRILGGFRRNSQLMSVRGTHSWHAGSDQRDPPRKRIHVLAARVARAHPTAGFAMDAANANPAPSKTGGLLRRKLFRAAVGPYLGRSLDVERLLVRTPGRIDLGPVKRQHVLGFYLPHNAVGP